MGFRDRIKKAFKRVKKAFTRKGKTPKPVTKQLTENIKGIAKKVGKAAVTSKDRFKSPSPIAGREARPISPGSVGGGGVSRRARDFGVETPAVGGGGAVGDFEQTGQTFITRAKETIKDVGRGVGDTLQQVSDQFAPVRKFLGTDQPQSPAELASGLVGGTVVKGAVKGVAKTAAAKSAREGLERMVGKYAAKFIDDAPDVIKAASGQTTAGAKMNTKKSGLIKNLLNKISKGQLWVAGALAAYAFETKLTFNILDDASSDLVFRASDAERNGDIEQLKRLEEMHDELTSAGRIARALIPIVNFPLQVWDNWKQDRELIKGTVARAGQPSPADLEYEERRKKREEEDARKTQEYEEARQRRLNEDDARFAERLRLLDEREARRREELEAYYDRIEKERRKKRSDERIEAEQYYENIRKRNQALLDEKRKEAEKYYNDLKKQNEKYYENRAPSSLNFGLL